MKMAHPFGERALVKQADSNEQMALDSLEGRFHVRWSPDEAVTSLGQVPFFIDFLKQQQADLFDPYVIACPLQSSSPNAPKARDFAYLARCCCPLWPAVIAMRMSTPCGMMAAVPVND